MGIAYLESPPTGENALEPDGKPPGQKPLRAPFRCPRTLGMLSIRCAAGSLAGSCLRRWSRTFSCLVLLVVSGKSLSYQYPPYPPLEMEGKGVTQESVYFYSPVLLTLGNLFAFAVGRCRRWNRRDVSTYGKGKGPRREVRITGRAFRESGDS